MAVLRLTNGFERLSDSKLLETSNFVHLCITGNANFPAPTPTMVEFADTINDFTTAVVAAGNGDRLQIARKKDKREALVEALHLVGYYVVYASGGNRVKAQTSGLALAKEPAGIALTKPVSLKVENSDQTGELLVSIKKVHGAAAYMHQYSTDPLLKEDSWMSLTCTSARCKIAGLKPGTKYYLRVAAIGAKAQLMFSDVVSKIAA